jgi:hypothetical protein
MDFDDISQEEPSDDTNLPEGWKGYPQRLVSLTPMLPLRLIHARRICSFRIGVPLK